MSCEDRDYSQYIQNFADMETLTMSDDGQPDEAKEWEDLEGIEQNMYPDEEPSRIHNNDSETDAVLAEHEHEKQHMIDLEKANKEADDLLTKLADESKDKIKRKKQEPKMYCISCGRVSTPLLCIGCRGKTIKARIQERLDSK